MRNALSRVRLLTKSCLGLIISLASVTVSAATLTEAVQLRLHPGSGYPVAIELPKDTYVDVISRQNDWLLLADERGNQGWSQVEDVRDAGGVDALMDWSWRELEDELDLALRFGLLSNPHTSGLSAALFAPVADFEAGFEINVADEAAASMTSVMAWGAGQYLFDDQYFLRFAAGIGGAEENQAGQRFSALGEEESLVLLASEFSAGWRMTSNLSSDFGLRIMTSDQPESAIEAIISWKWQLGI